MNCKYFLPFWSDGVFWCTNFFYFSQSPICLFFFLLLFVFLLSCLRSHYLTQGHKDLLLCFILATWEFSLMHLGLSSILSYFCYGVRQGYKFILLYVYIWLSQQHFLKKTLLSSMNCIHTLVKSINHKCVSTFPASPFCFIDPDVYPHASTRVVL